MSGNNVFFISPPQAEIFGVFRNLFTRIPFDFSFKIVEYEHFFQILVWVGIPTLIFEPGRNS